MIETAENNGINGELEKKEKNTTRIFFIRHGEPKEYTADESALSDNGVMQVVRTAGYLNYRLRHDPGDYKTAIYMHSDRLRAEQTANIMVAESEYYVDRHNLDINVKEIADPHAFISAENTLTKLIEESNITKEKAASHWLKLKPEEAKKMGIRSSKQVADEAKLLIAELMLLSKETTERLGSVYYFLGTHETTLMALLYHMPPKKEFKIGYADFIEIEANKPDGPRLTYKNKNLVVDYWEDEKDKFIASEQK